MATSLVNTRKFAFIGGLFLVSRIDLFNLLFCQDLYYWKLFYFLSSLTFSFSSIFSILVYFSNIVTGACCDYVCGLFYYT